MSKISDYLEAERQASEEVASTVEDFARELGKPIEELLVQLRAARVTKLFPSDTLSTEERHKLLTHLQRSHKSRKRKKIAVTVDNARNSLLKKVANRENGAEWALLAEIAGDVVWGREIDSATQKVLNLLVAKIVLIGALPERQRGRPKNEQLAKIGYEIAEKYWDMRDSGGSYQDAVTVLAQSFHKDERHIMRLVEKHKDEVGATFEIRERKRSYTKTMVEMYQRHPNMFDHYSALFQAKLPLPDFTFEDYMDHLSEMTTKIVEQLKPLTLKI